MYLKMRNGSVAIELLEPEEKSKGGIFIPITVRQGKLQFGKIVEAGPGELVQGQMVEMDLKKGDDIIFDASHSIFVSGVSESCLNSFVFLYSEEMLTSENIGLVRIENPIKPGMRKSMYFVCCVFTVAGVMLMIAGVVSLYFVWK